VLPTAQRPTPLIDPAGSSDAGHTFTSPMSDLLATCPPPT
jgi:hypothetical protein